MSPPAGLACPSAGPDVAEPARPSPRGDREENAMTEHPNVQHLRDGYDAFAKGDLAGLRELMTEDVVWHVAGHSEMSGQYEEIDAVLAFFGRMMEVTGGSFRLEPRTFLADDAYGAAPAAVTAHRGDRHLDAEHPRLPLPGRSGGRVLGHLDRPGRAGRVLRLTVAVLGAQLRAGGAGRTTIPSRSAHSHSPSRKTTPANSTGRPDWPECSPRSLLRGKVASARTPIGCAASSSTSRTQPLMTTPAQPFCAAATARLPPRSEQRRDAPPSTTRTRPSPGCATASRTMVLSSKTFSVVIGPQNAGTLP